MKRAQGLGKELATSSKRRKKTRKQANKQQKQTQSKHIPLVLDSNMSISKLLSSAKSSLEFGENQKCENDRFHHISRKNALSVACI